MTDEEWEERVRNAVVRGTKWQETLPLNVPAPVKDWAVGQVVAKYLQENKAHRSRSCQSCVGQALQMASTSLSFSAYPAPGDTSPRPSAQEYMILLTKQMDNALTYLDQVYREGHA